MSKKNQELLKDKVKGELTLFAKSLQLAQGQGRIKALEVEVELLKKILKNEKVANNKLKEVEKDTKNKLKEVEV